MEVNPFSLQNSIISSVSFVLPMKLPVIDFLPTQKIA
jgi:hypothetical protein